MFLVCALLALNFCATLTACGQADSTTTVSRRGEPRRPSAAATQLAAPAPKFCMVSHHDSAPPAFVALALASQRRYAARHGYPHATFVGHISGDDFIDADQGPLTHLRGGGLYWQKVRAVQEVLRHGIAEGGHPATPCSWAMWMDSDAIITNESVQLEDVVASYTEPPPNDRTPPVAVILAKEVYHPINSGVFFVRNSTGGHAFLATVTASYPLYKDHPLPDQAAIAAAAFAAERWPALGAAPSDVFATVHPSVAIAPQRAFDSFPFVNHENEAPLAARWAPCDFVAHYAGSDPATREASMPKLLATRASCEADVPATARDQGAVVFHPGQPRRLP